MADTCFLRGFQTISMPAKPVLGIERHIHNQYSPPGWIFLQKHGIPEKSA
ncbi:MAG: hypothetical protein IJA83_03240 [Clostridia bacterium]|nr:hypothetical protein [Clostridia bacterium]